MVMNFASYLVESFAGAECSFKRKTSKVHMSFHGLSKCSSLFSIKKYWQGEISWTCLV